MIADRIMTIAKILTLTEITPGGLNYLILLLGVGSFLRIHNEITRGISGGGPKKPSGSHVCL